eukprot:6193441-Pleurochrysis_carterae.AAC.2
MAEDLIDFAAAAGAAFQDDLALPPFPAQPTLASGLPAAAHDATSHRQSAVRNCVGSIFAGILSGRSAADKPTEVPNANMSDGRDASVEASPAVVATT